MSLQRFSESKRLVVQNPSTSAYDAARALESNHIGAVIVQDAGKVTGIVTDRDLALRVIGFDRDPREVQLRDVMTPNPVTLPIHASEREAAELMRHRHVRRIPLVDGDRIVGIVTLDDLILSRVVDVEEAAHIVEAQLDEPAAAKPAGVPYPTRMVRRVSEAKRQSEAANRHAARAEQTLHDFTRRLTRELSLEDPERALRAFVLVAESLVRRVTPQEAEDFAAQLPSTIGDQLFGVPVGPDFTISRESIEASLARELDLDDATAATLLRRIAGAMHRFVSAGELEDVVSQLPADMKELFTPTPEPPCN